MKSVNYLIFLVVLLTRSDFIQAQYNFNVKRPLSEINHKIVFTSYSPDGKYIITAGSDSSIIIWNADRLTVYRTLTGLKARPNIAVITPGNEYVLAGGKDNKISMWDLAVMPPAITRTFEGHKEQVKSIDVSPDGKYLASAGADGNIRIWDMLSTNLIYEFRGHKKDVNVLSFDPGGKKLASGGADGNIMLWNTDNGSLILSGTCHKGWIRDLAFSPDGNTLATCGDDRMIYLWQVSDLKKTGSFSGHKDWVHCIDFTPDGKNLISGARDKLLILWDVASQQILCQSDKQVQTINSVDISPVKSDFISSCFNTEDFDIWALTGLDESQWKKAAINAADQHISVNIAPEDKKDLIKDKRNGTVPGKADETGNQKMIELFSPAAVQGKIIHDKESILLVGRVTDPEGIISFRINGAMVKLAEAGIFQYNVALSAGENTIDMIAINNKAVMDQRKVIIECTSSGGISAAQNIPEVLKGRYCAFLIGISDYIDPGIEDLEYPVKDAENLYNVLVSKYTFNKENIVLLRNPTYEDITITFDSLVSALTSEDNLLIFYAGHGKWDEKGRVGSWFPSDASKTSTNNWFRNSVLRDYLSSISTKHTLLIADACFSGAIFKSRAAFTEPSKGIEKLYRLPSRKAMTSGILQEVPDESAFLKYLVNRLKDNDEQFLSSEELFIRFKSAVMDNSPNVPQFGVIQNVGDEGGDFIFVKR
jgi:WD40 repeat protein